MENVVQQVQQQVMEARILVEQLLRNSIERDQVDELRRSGMPQRQIDVLYPVVASNYSRPVRTLLEKPTTSKWLKRELAKLDPTAYCLHLPEATYEKMRKSLPDLPAEPSVDQELAYTAAFINHLAAENFEHHGHASFSAEEMRRWQSLLHQNVQITKVLRGIQQQLTPLGRTLNRLRFSAS